MADRVTQSELVAALDALILEDVPQPLGPDDITINVIAERAGCSWSKAKRLIERWTAEGKVEAIGERRNEIGRRVQAWRLK